MADDPSPERVKQARNAVATLFITVGVLFASWAARLPAIQEQLGVTAGELGLTLLSLSLGSVLTLPLAGAVVHRFGPVRTLRVTTTVIAVVLGLVGLATSPLVLAVVFFFMGTGVGITDVAMNVSAVDIEQRMKKTLMSRFHAGFSLGTVFGAGLGAAAAALHVSVGVHLAVVATLALAAFVWATVYLLPLQTDESSADQPARVPAAAPESSEAGTWDRVDACADPATAPAMANATASAATPSNGSGAGRAWREPRTLMLGLLVLGMAFSEGSANDWLAIGLRDGYGMSHAAGAAGFGLFVTAMTAGRMAGPWMLARYGRVRSLRAGAVAVLAGILAVGLGTFLPDGASGFAVALALVGAVVWGWGAALGFPVGMSAAGDEPARAAARVSVVATIGYTAFIAGPPLLGLLGDHYGTARALLAVTGAVLLSFVAAAWAAEPEDEPSQAEGAQQAEPAPQKA